MRIKIGTRNSPLAMWQAKEVASKINALGYETELIPVVSSGDKNLTQPLYSMGITGVFTRDLDIALLHGEIDIAVHSLKDVPTQMPENLKLIAYLERDFPEDVLVRSPRAKEKPLHELKVATSSLRRRAFWKKEFPNAEFTDIRGNVQTRLQKLNDGLADATLFSLAGLKRLALNIDYELLPFMVSAPSQGVVTIAGHEKNVEVNTIVEKINHLPTQICVEIERTFLQTMEGGCTAPIGAIVRFTQENQLHFHGRLCTLDGKKCLEINEMTSVCHAETTGYSFAQKMLENGGKEIMDSLKNNLNP